MSLSKLNKEVIYAYDIGYRVTTEGVLLRPNGIPIKGSPDDNKYLNTRIRKGYGHLYFHKLMAYQMFGDKLFVKGIQVRHLDGNPSNNEESNITIGTSRDNSMDIPEEVRLRTGRNAASYQRKLTEVQAQQLREDRKQGLKYRELMSKYDIAKSTVSYIVNNKTY